MSFKQVAIIIDDFSQQSVELFDNVWMYDYGHMESGWAWDYYLNDDLSFNGYGNLDHLQTNQVTSDGFYPVTYSEDVEWEYGFSNWLSEEAVTSTGLGGYEDYRYDYATFFADEHEVLGDSDPKHGDWVLRAFQQELLDQDSVEVILIDVDSDTNGNLVSEHYQSLFNIVPDASSPSGYRTAIDDILQNWLGIAASDEDLSNYTLLPSVVSMSIAGTAPDQFQIAALDSLSDQNITFVQSAPNVNGGFYDWSVAYPHVVSVGAWNIDSNNVVLAANDTAISTLDILANGYLDYSANGWGDSFGTSFATPRVSANLVNTWADIINDFELAVRAGEITQEDLESVPIPSQASIVEMLVSSVSTDVYVELDSGWVDGTVRVLSDDLTDSIEPQAVPTSLLPTINSTGTLTYSSATLSDPFAVQEPLVDSSAPVLRNLTFSVEPSTDSGLTRSEINVTARITDDLSGNAGEGYLSSPSQIRLRSPSGEQFIDVMLSEQELDSGTRLDGIYSDSVILPRFSETGVWAVEQVLLVDQVGNTRRLDSEGLIISGFENSVEIVAYDEGTQDIDLTPPTLLSLDLSATLTADAVDSYEITARARITDDLSGNAGEGYSSSPSQIRLRSPSGEQFVDLMLSGQELDSGTRLDGIYSDSVILPRFSETGLWRVEQVLLVDQVGNMSWLQPDDFESAGIQPTLLVDTSNIEDVSESKSELLGDEDTKTDIAPPSSPTTPDVANEQVILEVPIESIESIGFTPDGKSLVIRINGQSMTVVKEAQLTFSDQESSVQSIAESMEATPVFASAIGGITEYVLPEKFTGPASLGLDYQLIDDTQDAVVTGSSANDFIKLSSITSKGKAIDAGDGDDVVDGGVGSTFVTGGGGSNTFFLDGRAEGVSWSTITDFKLGGDKATIWGWQASVSKVAQIDEQGGAAGFKGVTLHFENLLPSDAEDGQTNSDLNSITFTDKTLADFGASSVEQLNIQIEAGTNSVFMTGVSEDQFGAHGYLYLG